MYDLIEVVVFPTLGSLVYASTTLNPFFVFHSISGCRADWKSGSETIKYLVGYVVIISSGDGGK